MKKRKEIANKLQGETLVRKGLMHERSGVEQVRMAPDLNVVKIGGHGVVDFGSEVVFPLVNEIGELSKNNEILLATGGGVRVRHIMDIGIDLGMPTGILADLSGTISEQNAKMIAILLAPYGGIYISNSDLLEVPMLIGMGQLPVMKGTPIFGLYETPNPVGPIPQHRTDTGAFLAAELLGAKRCILVKNVDGLYTESPLINPDAEFIPEIKASELVEMNLEDMVLEEKVVELLQYAKNLDRVNIINGHEPGNLTKLMNGEKLGTVIYR